MPDVAGDNLSPFCVFAVAWSVRARSVPLVLLLLTIAACGQKEAPESLPLRSEDLSPTLPKTLSAITPEGAEPIAQSPVNERDTITAEKSSTAPSTSTTSAPTAQPASIETATPSATITATPNPYAGLSIEELSRRGYGGGELDIVETMETEETFTRYLITYPSDGLTIYGYMNVPNEGSRFPVAIVLHGYIPPADYETVAYTERYANALAEAGYFVIHPNFRNYPPSDEGPDPYRIGFATDILNLIAIIREQSQDPNGYLRRADAEDINLFGHSMGGGIALRAITVNNDRYLRTAVLYAAMSGDELLNYKRIQEWSNGSVGQFELAASPETIESISPITHLDRIQAAISVHHSQADAVVPPEWSADLCSRLEALEKEHECFFYEGQPHTFRGPGDSLFIGRVIDFFNRH